VLKFTITPTDGRERYSLRATSRDILMWERTTKGGRTMGQLLNDLPVADLYKVARFAAIRQGLISSEVTVAEWESDVDIMPDLEVDEDGNGPDPTRPEPSTES
jgi:hypothetical protein